MDRNSIIGLVLIFVLFMVWQWALRPSPEQLEAQQRYQDSLAQVQRINDSLAALPQTNNEVLPETAAIVAGDSTAMARLAVIYGPFAAAATGQAQDYTLENNVFKVTFTSKGARVKEVELKEYFKIIQGEDHEETKIPLNLLEDAKNRFEWQFPAASLPSGTLKTSDLVFTAQQDNNSITFRAPAANGGYLEQKYSLQPGSYALDYQVSWQGLQGLVTGDIAQINWVNYLDRLEINTAYEQNNATIYYKETDSNPSYTSSTKAGETVLNDEPVKWVSHSNQFFNTALRAKESFKEAKLTTELTDGNGPDLKLLKTELAIPIASAGQGSVSMTLYSGPNEFKVLRSLGDDMEDIIPYGWSVLGTINRWVVRPVFDFLLNLISSKGLVILLLTIVVKAVVFPLTYKSIYSQSRMAALKPHMAKLKDKFKDDQQQLSMETMKIYREFGVSPLGGCMPVLLQMPVWFALYRFFPASIDFRQAGFLWATDLSSYDVITYLPFALPGFGSHISLFTIIWVITTLIYTYYNSQFMDFSANPAMKYVQYIMPVMFLFFFNNFASGLTAYLCFSNILNIGQTLITKNFIIDQDKIARDLEDYRKKPKKKGGFQERLEQALKEQQRQAQERTTTGRKKS